MLKQLQNISNYNGLASSLGVYTGKLNISHILICLTITILERQRGKGINKKDN